MLGSARSLQELFELFKNRSEPKFFGAFNDRENTVTELRRRLPGECERLIEKADAVVQARFDLLGFKDLSFGETIDWQLEPVSNKRSPNLHWSQLNFLDSTVVGDKKIIWEVNRHQHFVTLGQAYWLTGDEKYAKTFINHLNGWMDQNPPKIGINWASSLEVAFRSISWIWALYFFRESQTVSAETFAQALKFLYIHARHIETYLSTYFSPNTHLTGEALGLFYLGTFLPEFRGAERWRKTGLEILGQQLSKHIKPDGVYFEQSSYYHRYTTDFYLHLLILLRANRREVPAELEKSLTALLDHLMYITRPDGLTPLFGDDDGGRLVFLSLRKSNDFRATLATAAALFNRPDYKYVAEDVIDEAIWLLGANRIREFDLLESRPPADQSIAFKEGGYYVMRDGWTKKSNYLLFDCGPHGTLNCGHAHADALSFELCAGGSPMLIDPGTYTYTASKKMRDWFRSSVAHNVLTIDGESSSVPAGPFSWKTIAQCDPVNWISGCRFDFVKGQHDGYASLPNPVSLSRSILFLKQNYWILRDEMISSGDHRADLWFHFDPDAEALIEIVQNQPIVRVGMERNGSDIYVFGSEGAWRREDAWTSPCYGKSLDARAYAFSSLIRGDSELITFLLPYELTLGTKSVVRAVEAIGGKAFEVTHTDGFDIVMIRGAGCSFVETARLTSDFAWTWTRFSNESESLPTEFVLLDGQELKLEGREILKAKARMNYLAGHNLGKNYQIETDDGTFDLSLPILSFQSDFASSRPF